MKATEFLDWEEGEMRKDGEAEAGRVRGWLKVHGPRVGKEYTADHGGVSSENSKTVFLNLSLCA